MYARVMFRGRGKLLIVLLAVVFVVLAVAWIDGGRVEERLIEQPVQLAVPQTGVAGMDDADGERN